MKKLQLLFVLLISGLFYSQTYDIKLNLTKDQTYYLNNNITMNMVQKVMGQEMPMIMNMNIAMSYKVISIDKDIYTLQTQYDYVGNEVSMMGKNMKMASNLDQSNPANKIFSSMVNIPYTMKVKNNGEIISVDGYEKILESMKKSSDSDSGPMYGELEKSFSKEKATESLKSTFFSIPPKSVKIGDTWKASYNVENNGIKVKNNMDCKLESVDDQFYKISYKGTMVSDENGKITKNGMDINVKKFDGTMNGLVQLDKNSSWVKNTNSKGKMNMLMEMQMGDKPMEMESNIDMDIKIDDVHVSSPPMPMPEKVVKKTIPKKGTPKKGKK